MWIVIHKFKINLFFSNWKENKSFLKTKHFNHIFSGCCLVRKWLKKTLLFLRFWSVFADKSQKTSFFFLRFDRQSKPSYFSIVIFYVISLWSIDTDQNISASDALNATIPIWEYEHLSMFHFPNTNHIPDVNISD